jgi:hypothetical protein
MEIAYVQSFSYLRTKPTLCTSCSPAQVLLASKPTKSSPNPPPSPRKQTSLHCLPCLSHPIFLRDVPVMVSSQLLLANSGLNAIPALGELMLPPCGPRASPGFIRVCLVLYWGTSDWLWHLTTLFPHLMPLLPETVTLEWRFHVAKSVPVPLSGSDLQAQVTANPSGMCHASRLCLPLPGCTGTLASHEKFVA